MAVATSSRHNRCLRRARTAALVVGLLAMMTVAHAAPEVQHAAAPEDTVPDDTVPKDAVPNAVRNRGPHPIPTDAAPLEPLTEVERKRRETAELCQLLRAAADRHGVPDGFFIRLIWKESRFNPNAVSPVGAQGIAQFMPGTARIRGLKNPFDREEALFASAAFLADLYARFGSWGLAAAGYNGGPNRIPPFVEGAGGLPYETIDYVYAITGRTARYWVERVKAARHPDPGPPEAAAAADPTSAALTGTADPSVWRRPAALELLPAGARFWPRAEREPESLPHPPQPRPAYSHGPVDCPKLVARLGTSRSIAPPMTGLGGAGGALWGAQVAGHPKRAVALRQYDRIKSRLPADLVAQGPAVVVRRFAARGRLPIHAVQFAAQSKGAAEAMCKRIAKRRAACVVVKNS